MSFIPFAVKNCQTTYWTVLPFL